MDRTNNRGSGFMFLIMLAFLGAGALFVLQRVSMPQAVQAVQLNLHSVYRHGDGAAAVADLFNSDGSCKPGPSVEMYSQTRGTWLNLCFHDDGASAWITIDRISSERANNEVTTIPRAEMSKPVQYLRSVLNRDGYVVKFNHGQAPEWFQTLLESLMQ